MGKGNPSYIYICITGVYIYINMCANYIKLRSISNQAWLNIAVYFMCMYISQHVHIMSIYLCIVTCMGFQCSLLSAWSIFNDTCSPHTYSPPHVYTCKDVYMYMSFHVQPKDTHLHDTYLYICMYRTKHRFTWQGQHIEYIGWHRCLPHQLHICTWMKSFI